MPRPRRDQTDAAEALVAVAPLATRWIERLLAAHEPPLTVPQYLALRAIAHEDISGTELARRAGVSGPRSRNCSPGSPKPAYSSATRSQEIGAARRCSLSAAGEQAYPLRRRAPSPTPRRAPHRPATTRSRRTLTGPPTRREHPLRRTPSQATAPAPPPATSSRPGPASLTSPPPSRDGQRSGHTATSSVRVHDTGAEWKGVPAVRRSRGARGRCRHRSSTRADPRSGVTRSSGCNHEH